MSSAVKQQVVPTPLLGGGRHAALGNNSTADSDAKQLVVLLRYKTMEDVEFALPGARTHSQARELQRHAVIAVYHRRVTCTMATARKLQSECGQRPSVFSVDVE